MELWKKLGILTFILISLGVFVIAIEVFNSQPNIKQEVRIDSLTDSLSLTLYAPKSDGFISSLDLKIHGNIKGSGIITISYSDSVIHQSYTISDESVNIEYFGDWYHDFFHLKFFPDSISTGILNIVYAF